LERAKTYFSYGVPISGGLIIGILLSSGDRFLISGFLGEAAVGAYAAGFQVASRVIDMIFLWAKSAVTPVLIAAYERGGTEEARRVAPFGYALRLGIGAPAALGIAMLADPICGLLIGESLRARAAEIVPWIAVAALLLGIGDYFSDAFMLAKKSLLHSILLLCPMILNLTLNLALLPTLGLRGAVIASVVAYGISAILQALIGRRYMKLPVPLGTTGKIALACACMAGVLWALPDLNEPINLVYKIGLGALTYGICAYVLDIAQVRGEAQRIWARIRQATGHA
jgi:O-antigen/teichoic acid export membrane protein